MVIGHLTLCRMSHMCTMTEDVHYRHVIYPMCRMSHIHDGRRPLNVT